jgi:hypothetical protein
MHRLDQKIENSGCKNTRKEAVLGDSKPGQPLTIAATLNLNLNLNFDLPHWAGVT